MTNFSLNWDKQKHYEYTKAWKLEHPEQVKEQHDKSNKKYREKYPDRVKKSREKWSEKNPERRKAFISLWDHRQKGFPVLISSKEAAELLKRAKYCPVCGIEMKYGNGTACGESPSIDRRNNSPILDIKTINIICHRCNSRKGNKPDALILGHAREEEERKRLAEHLDWIFEQAGLGDKSHQCENCRKTRALILGRAREGEKEK